MSELNGNGRAKHLGDSPFSSRSRVATQDDVLDASRAIFERVSKSLDSRLDQSEVAIAMRFSKALELETDKRLKSLEEAYSKRIEGAIEKAVQTERQGFQEMIKSLQKNHEEQIGFLKRAQEDALEQFKILLQNVPLHVHIPDSMITVQMPEAFSPVINLPPTIPPEVIVNIPEQKETVVNVEVPKRLLRKTFTYDNLGRPLEVIEQEI